MRVLDDNSNYSSSSSLDAIMPVTASNFSRGKAGGAVKIEDSPKTPLEDVTSRDKDKLHHRFAREASISESHHLSTTEHHSQKLSTSSTHNKTPSTSVVEISPPRLHGPSAKTSPTIHATVSTTNIKSPSSLSAEEGGQRQQQQQEEEEGEPRRALDARAFSMTPMKRREHRANLLEQPQGMGGEEHSSGKGARGDFAQNYQFQEGEKRQQQQRQQRQGGGGGEGGEPSSSGGRPREEGGRYQVLVYDKSAGGEEYNNPNNNKSNKQEEQRGGGGKRGIGGNGRSRHVRQISQTLEEEGVEVVLQTTGSNVSALSAGGADEDDDDPPPPSRKPSHEEGGGGRGGGEGMHHPLKPRPLRPTSHRPPPPGPFPAPPAPGGGSNHLSHSGGPPRSSVTSHYSGGPYSYAPPPSQRGQQYPTPPHAVPHTPSSTVSYEDAGTSAGGPPPGLASRSASYAGYGGRPSYRPRYRPPPERSNSQADDSKLITPPDKRDERGVAKPLPPTQSTSVFSYRGPPPGGYYHYPPSSPVRRPGMMPPPPPPQDQSPVSSRPDHHTPERRPPYYSPAPISGRSRGAGSEGPYSAAQRGGSGVVEPPTPTDSTRSPYNYNSRPPPSTPGGYYERSRPPVVTDASFDSAYNATPGGVVPPSTPNKSFHYSSHPSTPRGGAGVGGNGHPSTPGGPSYGVGSGDSSQPPPQSTPYTPSASWGYDYPPTPYGYYDPSYYNSPGGAHPPPTTPSQYPRSSYIGGDDRGGGQGPYYSQNRDYYYSPRGEAGGYYNYPPPQYPYDYDRSYPYPKQEEGQEQVLQPPPDQESQEEEEEVHPLLRDYDPAQDSRGIRGSGAVDDDSSRGGGRSGGRPVAAAAALLQPPAAASEIDFEVTKPPMEPVTPPSKVPVCPSASQVNTYDVLCGRGGGTNSQIGNRRFRKLVHDFQPIYLMARRKEKPLIARSIVLIIRKRGGRFLKKDDNTGELYEVGDEKAEAKTSQALREGLDVRATKSAASSLLQQGDKRSKSKKKGHHRSSSQDSGDEGGDRSIKITQSQETATSQQERSIGEGGGARKEPPFYSGGEGFSSMTPLGSRGSYDEGDGYYRGGGGGEVVPPHVQYPQYYPEYYPPHTGGSGYYQEYAPPPTNTMSPEGGYSPYRKRRRLPGSSTSGPMGPVPAVSESLSEDDHRLMMDFSPPRPSFSHSSSGVGGGGVPPLSPLQNVANVSMEDMSTPTRRNTGRGGDSRGGDRSSRDTAHRGQQQQHLKTPQKSEQTKEEHPTPGCAEAALFFLSPSRWSAV